MRPRAPKLRKAAAVCTAAPGCDFPRPTVGIPGSTNPYPPRPDIVRKGSGTSATGGADLRVRSTPHPTDDTRPNGQRTRLDRKRPSSSNPKTARDRPFTETHQGSSAQHWVGTAFQSWASEESPFRNWPGWNSWVGGRRFVTGHRQEGCAVQVDSLANGADTEVRAPNVLDLFCAAGGWRAKRRGV